MLFGQRLIVYYDSDGKCLNTQILGNNFPIPSKGEVVIFEFGKYFVDQVKHDFRKDEVSYIIILIKIPSDLQ